MEPLYKLLIILLSIAAFGLTCIIASLAKTIISLEEVNSIQSKILSTNCRSIDRLQNTAIERGELLIKLLKILQGEEENDRS